MSSTIMKINVSNAAKAYFINYGFEEIIQDRIFFDENEDNLKHARENLWTFTIDPEVCTMIDVYKLYHAIIDSRERYLKSIGKLNKMLFYTWYDDMSGSFCFSLIRMNSQSLPFESPVKKVFSLYTIIKNFRDDKLKGFIPWTEMLPQENLNWDTMKKYVDVWVKTL